jgi:hypothetical protein
LTSGRFLRALGICLWGANSETGQWAGFLVFRYKPSFCLHQEEAEMKYQSQVRSSSIIVILSMLLSALGMPMQSAIAQDPIQDTGPGGPILVIADASNTTNPFGRYYAEILRAEGFNAYYVMDISNISAATLAEYDVVLLGEMPLTSSQISMFDDWVASGGNLIAFRPAKALAALYGLADANGTTSEGYLAVNTTTSIGQGVIGDTLQYHGTADHYTLSGATQLATLYSNATTSTPYPAIVRYSHGNGQVVIFTFDLARSIILMRQGNPAWAGVEGDGVFGIRALDMFVGRSGQPDWVNPSKMLIPQADEQMHVLSHAIEQVNASQQPLPRLWYFPDNIKGALIMTGDSEGCGGSCVNAPIQHVQSYGGTYTAYLLGTQPTLTEVNGWLAAGHGVAPHYDDTAEAGNPTYANMNSVYDTMTQNHINAYGVAPRTVRHHWITWVGWSEQAEIEVAHGILTMVHGEASRVTSLPAACQCASRMRTAKSWIYSRQPPSFPMKPGGRVSILHSKL